MVRAPGTHSDKPYDRPRPSDEKWVHDRAPRGPARHTVFAGPTQRASPTNRLVVSNLHYEVTTRDLISIFGQIGTLVREPDIKYDRSGRSTGVAIIHFETDAEATRAKNQLQNVVAKGQPMEIAYDTRPVKPTGRGSKSLLNRISKPPLLDRLVSSAPHSKGIISEPARSVANGGPVRTRGGRRGGARGERFRKEPKTAEDLDKELEAFMHDDIVKPGGSSTSSAPAGDADVEMAT